MSLIQSLMRALTALALAASLIAPTVQAQSASTHALIIPPQPTGSPGKIEVLAFFFYNCPRCLPMESALESWSKSLPENVVLRRVPVDFMRNYAHWERLYYTLEIMDRMDLHRKHLSDVITIRKGLHTYDGILQWVISQGVDPERFKSVFNSDPVADKVTLARELATVYDVEELPTMIVAGKYLVSYSMTGDLQSVLDETTKLIEQERKAIQ